MLSGAVAATALHPVRTGSHGPTDVERAKSGPVRIG